MKECPIKRYKIDRIIVVMNNETMYEKDDFVTINKDGSMKLHYFSSAKPRMEIYISASTSLTKINDTWSAADKPIAIYEIKLKNAPNIEPNFMRPLDNIEFVVNSTSKTMKYTFPPIFDPEGDKVKLSITKGFLNESMTYYTN